MAAKRSGSRRLQKAPDSDTSRIEAVGRDTVYWNGSLRCALFPVNSVPPDDHEQLFIRIALQHHAAVYPAVVVLPAAALPSRSLVPERHIRLCRSSTESSPSIL